MSLKTEHATEAYGSTSEDYDASRADLNSSKRPDAYTHPHYDHYFDLWEFWRRSYEGGYEYLKEYLDTHPQEDEEFYDLRLKRAVVLNYIRSIVDTYASQVFKNSVARGSVDAAGKPNETEVLTTFHADVTQTGVQADSFYLRALKGALTYGHIWVVVDRKEVEGVRPLTRAQERELGRRPYGYLVPPQDLVNWSVDRKGEFNWVVLREWHSVEDSAEDEAFVKPWRAPIERFRVWTRDKWFLYRVEKRDKQDPKVNQIQYDYFLEEEGEHPCGRVPLEGLYVGERKNTLPLAESFIKDLSPLMKRVVNLTSLVDEQLYQNVFNILVVGETTFAKLNELHFGVAGSIPHYREEKPPFYLAPGTGAISTLRSEIQETETAIRMLSGIGRRNEATRSSQSGVALSFHNTDKKALIQTFAESLQDLERRVDGLVLAWAEESEDQVSLAQYTIELESDEVETAIADALAIQTYGVRGEIAKENLVQMVKAAFGSKVSAERLAELLADVDANFDKWVKEKTSPSFLDPIANVRSSERTSGSDE